ncbi:MAG: class I SAM-dependent methyltransferase, partial [Proteobacteria bacterium]|nr:class I SAM-dependent methyltransferase [Pseudomonadota bacterium]
MQTFDTAEHLIEQANPAIYVLETETGMGDRRMLLALHNIVRRCTPAYAYAEIGSYMGGSLVPHLMDRRCGLVVSIDRRPDVQPDERGVSFDYTRSPTAAMLDRLHENLPLSAMLKLQTHDCDAADLPEDAGATPFDLMFIDGEHTNRAAFSDFLSLWRFAKPDCIVVF